MNRNVIEVLETCGKEIKALKEAIQFRDWENATLKEKNKEQQHRIEYLETELKAARDANWRMQGQMVLKTEEVEHGKL